MTPLVGGAARGSWLAVVTVLLQGCEIGERPAMESEKDNFKLLVPNSARISPKPVKNKQTEELPIRPLQQKEKPPAPKSVVPTTPQPTRVPQPVPTPPAPAGPPNCPELNLDVFTVHDADGRLQISQSMVGEFPKITCSSGLEYHGPRIQCNWVDRACKVGLERDVSVSSALCHMEYNLTLPGAGLTSWPQGVAPKLVPQWEMEGIKGAAPPKDEARTRILQTINLKNVKRNTDALPAVVNRNLLVCKPQKLPDLDFEHAPINRSYPPFSLEKPWFTTFSRVMAVNDEDVDLRVTRVGSVEAPGNPWLNGNSSAVGRISVNSTEQTHLRFQFLRSGTLAPVVLRRVYFTLFDMDGGHGSVQNKMVTVGGMVAYYIFKSSSVLINKTSDGRFEFLGAGNNGGRQPSDSSVEDMWLNSLKRTVVLDFRDTAEFTIAVQVIPHPNGQVLEFAGRSELVDQGTKVSTAEDQAAILQRFSASSDHRPDGEQVTDVNVERNSGATSPSLSTLPPSRQLPTVVIAAAGLLLLAAITGLGASACRRQKWQGWPNLEERHQGIRCLNRLEVVCTTAPHEETLTGVGGVHEMISEA